MNGRKQIAVVAQEYKEVFGVKHNYMQFLYQFGDVHIATHLSQVEHLLEMDLVVLPGGPDVDPARYKQKKEWFTGDPDGFLESFDLTILPSLVGRVSIFGICRGLQTLNVHFGGTLFQDILYYRDREQHKTSREETDLAHDVKLSGNGAKFKVNSFHHQAVDVVAPPLDVTAKSEDGYVEAMYSKELGVFAVQWHPERMVKDEYTMHMVDTLLGN